MNKLDCCSGLHYYFLQGLQLLHLLYSNYLCKGQEKTWILWGEDYVLGFFGKEFHLNDKWFSDDRKGKKTPELSDSIRDEQILTGRRSELVQF